MKDLVIMNEQMENFRMDADRNSTGMNVSEHRLRQYELERNGLQGDVQCLSESYQKMLNDLKEQVALQKLLEKDI